MGEVTTISEPIRLNIGAGDTVIDGFTPIDRKFGTEAFPLNYPDGSVEEIRASHLLEHLNFEEAQAAFKEWYRVLKPGGRLRVAVPDARKVLESMDTDEHWRFHLFGGQTDQNDYHRSGYDEGLLHRHFEVFGFENISKWESPNTDTAAHPCSLNLEGFKPNQLKLNIAGVVSIPRIGWNDHWGCVQDALGLWGVPLHRFTGAYWGHGMTKALKLCQENGTDIALCLDYDTVFTKEHFDAMLGIFCQNPHIDALAAMQCRRQSDKPLMSAYGNPEEIESNGEPILVTTAHFGFTLLRVEALQDVEKPWFWSKPDEDDEWGDHRMDDDIYFWHQWRKAGKTIYVAPTVNVGHLQVMVSQFNDEGQAEHIHVTEWRERQKAVAK